MAEERPNVFLRALDAVQNVIRPDYSLNREVQRAAVLAIATEQRALIDFARNEAVDYLSKLAEIPRSERDHHLKLERIDPGETSQWRPEDWTEKAKLIAKVETDVEAWAKDKKLDLATHDDRFAAYVGVGSAYGAAHLAVNFKGWEEDYWAARSQIDRGPVSPAPEERVEPNVSERVIPFSGHQAAQQAAVAAGYDAEARGDRVIHVHGRPFLDPGNGPEVSADTVPKRAPQTVIEEARAARIDAALSDMADAVIAGERPRFRTDEQATAFLRDFETRYGAGAMERLRAGDSTDLARDEPDPSRVAIKGAALRMVAESHAVLRGPTREQERPHIQTLDRESGHGLDL